MAKAKVLFAFLFMLFSFLDCCTAGIVISHTIPILNAAGTAVEKTVVDCPPGMDDYITAAYQDAIALAQNAAGQLRKSPNSIQFANLYGKLFAGRKDSANIGSVANNYDAAAGMNFVVHCTNDWFIEKNARLARQGVSPTWTCVDDDFAALTDVLHAYSGTDPRAVAFGYGAYGPFGSGSHIVLCQPFFDQTRYPSIRGLQPAVNTAIGNYYLNTGAILLHELMHTVGLDYFDFAYGFVKCVALTSNTQRNPDTYALFATGVSGYGSAYQFDWSSGFAQVPQQPAQ